MYNISSKVFNTVVIIVTLSLVVLGCTEEPEARSASSNPAIAVDKLFTHEGCTVYRFRDGGRDHYYAHCSDGELQTITTQYCGKSCEYPEVIKSR